MRRGAPLRDTGLAALFFLLATVLFTWPIAAHVTDGLGDLWDAKLNAWILHWDFHQAFRDPIHLYDANIFYPARYALAFSENLLGAAVFAFPLYAAGVSTLAAYNVVFLLGMFLSAMAAWALARDVTGDPVASLAAGLVYAFCPWRIAQIPHIQFQWGAFLALSLLFLLRYLDRGKRRDLALFAVCFAWNALCNVHYALFSGFLVGLTLAYEGLAAGWRSFRPRLTGALAAMAAAVLVVLPVLLPYAHASKLYGMQRGDAEIAVFSGVWTDFLTAGGQNKLYAPLTEKWAKAEGELFPGLTALALAAIALSRRRGEGGVPAPRETSPARRRIARVFDLLLLAGLGLWIASLSGFTAIGPLKVREPGRVAVVLSILAAVRLALAFSRRSRFADLGDFLRRVRIGTRAGLFLALAVLGVVVALGMHTPYYRFLVQSFGPIFHVIRAPVRGIVLFDLGLGVLAAWGLADVSRSRRPAARWAMALAAVLLIGLEYRAFPLSVGRVEPEPSPVYRWLAGIPVVGSVVEFPLGYMHDQEYEFRSTAHWKPIVNGASGFSPPAYDALARVLEQKPIPESVWDLLAKHRASLLLFHAGAGEPDTVAAYAELVGNGLRSGRIGLLRSFPRSDGRDFAFRLNSAPAGSLPVPDGPAADRERRLLDAALEPPIGYLDVPQEGAEMRSGEGGFGWALDDSGIRQVTVSADGGPALQAVTGGPHPGPERVYPSYRDAARAGFGFTLPPLPPGKHALTVTVVARDGGLLVFTRTIRIVP